MDARAGPKPEALPHHLITAVDEVVRAASLANALRCGLIDEAAGLAGLRTTSIDRSGAAFAALASRSIEARRRSEVCGLRLRFAVETTTAFIDERSEPGRRSALNETALAFAWRRVTEELARLLTVAHWPKGPDDMTGLDPASANAMRELKEASAGKAPHRSVTRHICRVALDRRDGGDRVAQSDPVAIRWHGAAATGELRDASRTGLRIAAADAHLPPAGTLVSLTLPSGEIMTGNLVWAQKDSGGLQLFTQLDANHRLVQQPA